MFKGELTYSEIMSMPRKRFLELRARREQQLIDEKNALEKEKRNYNT
jgi:hypothetical protein